MPSSFSNLIDVLSPEHSHFVPSSWYKHIHTQRGRVDLIAILLLADIFYTCFPHFSWHAFYEKTITLPFHVPPKTVTHSYAYYTETFCSTTAHIASALGRLERNGFISRVFHTSPKGNKLSVFSISLNLEKIKDITYGHSSVEALSDKPPVP